jgi:hypothetical protein
MPRTIPVFPVDAARDFWSDWVFKESARRTLLITFFFIQAYRYMIGVRTPNTCGHNIALCLSWYMSEHLWSAKDPVDFALAWGQKKHMICTPYIMNK